MAQEITEASSADRMFAALQRILPTRWLSLQVYRLTQIRNETFKNLLIKLFLRGFTIDLSEAEYSAPEFYDSFNHFFTRALRPGARPLPSDPRAVASPVDGTISQFGEIREGQIFQAKGHTYSVVELLGGDTETAEAFLNGRFCTIYLAPYNYHRIHMPLNGTLRGWSYVPGRLFSVNAATARAMPNLFARNERVNTLFNTDAGLVGLTMVGALFVGSMETIWAGQISPPHTRGEPSFYEPMQPRKLQRGDEMGRFNMGSTIILLLPAGAVDWDASLQPGQAVRMGQSLGTWHPQRS